MSKPTTSYDSASSPSVQPPRPQNKSTASGLTPPPSPVRGGSWLHLIGCALFREALHVRKGFLVVGEEVRHCPRRIAGAVNLHGSEGRRCRFFQRLTGFPCERHDPTGAAMCGAAMP